jgi:hypothetical protein
MCGFRHWIHFDGAIQKLHTPVSHMHGQLDTMHTHSHTTMHTRVRPTSKWHERVPSPSHKPLMIMSCLFSIEILNFSTANNKPFFGRGRPSFYFNSKKPAQWLKYWTSRQRIISHLFSVVGLRFISIQRRRPNDYCNKKLIQGIKPVIKCKVYVNYFVTVIWHNTWRWGTSNGDSGNQWGELEVRGWHNYYSNKRMSPAHAS